MDDVTADRTFETFKKLVPHLRGSLWWGENEHIKAKTPSFNQSDSHLGHPLLSILNKEVEKRTDAVPMLVGTSGLRTSEHVKRCCIVVKGMTSRDRDRRTYFGTIIEPSMYSVDDMIDGVSVKRGERSIECDKNGCCVRGVQGRLRSEHWTGYHVLVPNHDKPMVTPDEMAMVEDYCRIHQL